MDNTIKYTIVCHFEQLVQFFKDNDIEIKKKNSIESEHIVHEHINDDLHILIKHYIINYNFPSLVKKFITEDKIEFIHETITEFDQKNISIKVHNKNYRNICDYQEVSTFQFDEELKVIQCISKYFIKINIFRGINYLIEQLILNTITDGIKNHGLQQYLSTHHPDIVVLN